MAFAGAYDGTETVKIVPKNRNNTIYAEGDSKVNLDKYGKYVISGKSLEKVGIKDGTFVYTIGPDNDLYDLRNRFVIFRYDNNRLSKEHPEINNVVEGYKARKVISVIPTKLSEQNFETELTGILSCDSEIDDKTECLSRIWKKYQFASDFYSDDSLLILSITYKDKETRKDYSFHSPRFLEGVVKYKSLSN